MTKPATLLVFSTCVHLSLYSTGAIAREHKNQAGHIVWKQGLQSMVIGLCPVSATPSIIFRLVLKDKMDINDPNARNIHYVISKNASDLPDDDDTGIDDTPTGQSPNTNPYHVDLTVFNTSTVGSYAEIRIVLRDSKYTFWEPTDPASSDILDGVAVGDLKNKGGICGLAEETSKKGSPIRTFLVPITMTPPSGTANKPKYYPFNILLQSTTATDTPMIIDPKIENNG